MSKQLCPMLWVPLYSFIYFISMKKLIILTNFNYLILSHVNFRQLFTLNGCCNILYQSVWLINGRNHFSKLWNLERSRSCEGPHPVLCMIILPVFLQGRDVSESLLTSLIRVPGVLIIVVCKTSYPKGTISQNILEIRFQPSDLRGK